MAREGEGGSEREREKESERERARESVCVCEREKASERKRVRVRVRERRNSPAQPGYLHTEQNGISDRRGSASTGERRARASDLQDVHSYTILTHYKSHGIVEL